MSLSTAHSWIVSYAKSLTLEPMHFVYVASQITGTGALQVANLQFLQVCHYELGYSEDICDNLDAPENDAIETEVQRVVNAFQENSVFISAVPGVVYALFAGALSDNIGLKPLLLMPMIGALLQGVVELCFYLWIDILPLEFMYLENLFYFLGGFAVYYLGYYGMGNAITNQEERASRFARFDGFEQSGLLVGLLLSPQVFHWGGYWASFLFKIVGITLAILYLLFVIREPERRFEVTSLKKEREQSEGQKSVLRTYFEFFFWNPFSKMLRIVFRKRENNLRLLLVIQLFIYGMYWMLLQQKQVLYLFQLKTFVGFDGSNAAYVQAYDRITGIIGLFIITPYISKVLHAHDALSLTVIQFLNATCSLTEAFTVELWQFYLASTLLLMEISQYSLARALFTKSVHEDEVGGLFSAIAFLSATMPLVGTAIFRELYDATLDTFAGAFLLLSAGISFILGCSNFFLYTQRNKMLVDRMGRTINRTQEQELGERAPRTVSGTCDE